MNQWNRGFLNVDGRPRTGTPSQGKYGRSRALPNALRPRHEALAAGARAAVRLLLRNDRTCEGAGGKIPVDGVVLVGLQEAGADRLHGGGVARHQGVRDEDESV